MTSHIDHAPGSDPNNNSEDDVNPAHPETLGRDYNSQMHFGGHVPGEPQPHIDRVDTNRNIRRGLFITAGALLALSGVVASALYLGPRIAGKGFADGVKSGLPETTSQTYDPNSESSVSKTEQDVSKINPDQLTEEEFYNDSVYPEKARIRWASRILEERSTPEKISEMNTLMATGNRPPLGEIVAPAETNTADQILARQSLYYYIASTDPSPEEGRKLLAGFISPENPGLDGTKSQLGSGQDPITATYVAARADTTLPPYETPVFRETVVGGYNPNGDPSKFMMIQNTFDSKFSEITVKLVEDSWITVNTINPGDRNWVNKPRDLAVK